MSVVSAHLSLLVCPELYLLCVAFVCILYAVAGSAVCCVSETVLCVCVMRVAESALWILSACGSGNACVVCVLVRFVYVCEGVGTGPERVSVRCVRDVYVWECLGLVVCTSGGCVGPSGCQVYRECVCRSVSGADVSVSVRAGCVSRNVASVVRSWAVAVCPRPRAARGAGGRVCV